MNTITLLILFVPVLVLILLLVNLLLAVHRPDSEKVTPYECGFSPIYSQTRNPFHISFYLVGILFLVFDLEILLSYPLAVTLYGVSAYGYWVFLIFFAVLTVGFVYEFASGALYFTDKRSSLRQVEILPPKDLPPYKRFIKPHGDTGSQTTTQTGGTRHTGGGMPPTRS